MKDIHLGGNRLEKEKETSPFHCLHCVRQNLILPAFKRRQLGLLVRDFTWHFHSVMIQQSLDHVSKLFRIHGSALTPASGHPDFGQATSSLGLSSVIWKKWIFEFRYIQFCDLFHFLKYYPLSRKNTPKRIKNGYKYTQESIIVEKQSKRKGKKPGDMCNRSSKCFVFQRFGSKLCGSEQKEKRDKSSYSHLTYRRKIGS